MPSGDSPEILKALFGDDDEEVVKSGTLAVTRLTGWVAAAGLAVTNTEVFGELSGSTKLWGSIVIVAVFAFIASADSLARAYATAHTQPDVRVLTSPLKVKLTEGVDDPGWRAVIVGFTPAKPDDLDFWVVKGNQAKWVASSNTKPE